MVPELKYSQGGMIYEPLSKTIALKYSTDTCPIRVENYKPSTMFEDNKNVSY